MFSQNKNGTPAKSAASKPAASRAAASIPAASKPVRLPLLTSWRPYEPPQPHVESKEKKKEKEKEKEDLAEIIKARNTALNTIKTNNLNTTFVTSGIDGLERGIGIDQTLCTVHKGKGRRGGQFVLVGAIKISVIFRKNYRLSPHAHAKKPAWIDESLNTLPSITPAPSIPLTTYQSHHPHNSIQHLPLSSTTQQVLQTLNSHQGLHPHLVLSPPVNDSLITPSNFIDLTQDNDSIPNNNLIPSNLILSNKRMLDPTTDSSSHNKRQRIETPAEITLSPSNPFTNAITTSPSFFANANTTTTNTTSTTTNTTTTSTTPNLNSNIETFDSVFDEDNHNYNYDYDFSDLSFENILNMSNLK